MKYILEIKEHEDCGNMGAIIKGSPDFMEPGDGFLIAHDLIEHPVKHHHNPQVDELMASGVIYYFRVLYSGRTRSEYRSLNDKDVVYIVVTLLEYLETDVIKYQVKNPALLDIVNNSIELNNEVYDESYLFSDTPTLCYWMQQGINRFKNRFGKIELSTLDYIWQQVQTLVDNWLKCGSEGDKAELQIIWNSGIVRLKEYYDESGFN